MKMLWILAAAATFSACAKNSDDVGAAPDRGDDTTAVTTEVDTATGTWDTTSTSGDVNAQPSDTPTVPTTPSEAYPDTAGTDAGMTTDTTLTSPDTGAYAPDTGAYVPETSPTDIDTSSTGGYEPSTGVDTSGVDDGMGTDSSAVPADPNMPADSTYPAQ